MSDWRASILDRHDFFIRDSASVVVYRRVGDRVEYRTPDGPYFAEEGMAPDPEVRLAFDFPLDALVALRDAIDEKLGRRYDEVLVFELRANLERERDRNAELVERFADAALDRSGAFDLVELFLSRRSDS